MEVLSGPWADLALFLRQTVTRTDRETDSFLQLCLFGLFVSVCILLLQLMVYLHWKLSQVEADLTGFSHDRSAIFRLVHRNAQRAKKHRRACVHQTTLDSKYRARKEHA